MSNRKNESPIEGYPLDWRYVCLMVSPGAKEMHAVGGDRASGDGDSDYTGRRRIIDRIADLTRERDELADGIEKVNNEAVRIRRELERQRDEALKLASDEARKRGEAEGKLLVSESYGVIEGWRERAEKAEAERDAAVKAKEVAEARLFPVDPGPDPVSTHGRALIAALRKRQRVNGKVQATSDELNYLLEELERLAEAIKRTVTK